MEVKRFSTIINLNEIQDEAVAIIRMAIRRVYAHLILQLKNKKYLGLGLNTQALLFLFAKKT